MFPGMGAFSFLARRLDLIQAERMILSGKVYSAEELHEIGVVDRLAEDGTGMDAVHEFLCEYGRARHARQAVLRARKIVTPVSLRELIEVADLWVETALKLGPTDLRKMRHLARAQDRRWTRFQEDRVSGAVSTRHLSENAACRRRMSRMAEIARISG
jgi:DSF synthase